MVHRYSNVGVGLTIAIFFIVAVERGTALKCWTCSSQTSTNCNDYFNKTEDRYGQVRLQDCDNDRIHSSYSSYSTAVCKKQKQRMSGGETVILRHCDWVTEHSRGDPRDRTRCDTTTAPTYIKVDYCETCSEDGCNGSPKNMLAPIWSTVIPFIMYFVYRKTM